MKESDRKHNLEAFERDFEFRQRNVVFPETVQNEGQFYRNILAADRQERMPLNPLQRLGVLLLTVFSVSSASPWDGSSSGELSRAAKSSTVAKARICSIPKKIKH